MIHRFAEKHKLRTTRDECGDPIIRGKRGHLYIDGGEVCAMWTDAPPMNRSRLERLGGKVWQGDIGRAAHRRRLQDAWVCGIRPDAHKLAIRVVGPKARRAMSPAQWTALEKARRASSLIPIRTVQDDTLPA